MLTRRRGLQATRMRASTRAPKSALAAPDAAIVPGSQRTPGGLGMRFTLHGLCVVVVMVRGFLGVGCSGLLGGGCTASVVVESDTSFVAGGRCDTCRRGALRHILYAILLLYTTMFDLVPARMAGMAAAVRLYLHGLCLSEEDGGDAAVAALALLVMALRGCPSSRPCVRQPVAEAEVWDDVAMGAASCVFATRRPATFLVVSARGSG